ncbi:hypothetical protein PNP59_09655 [Halobacterium salinarum]|nr:MULTISPECIES: hypothetical protein [Halobacterium]MDL0131195.1 hypothetical protein [Halobacterium salinarum]MDL0132473.1 hypothetical protein [Halobacterium salinarum]MDL0143541.1 hypothetical protein [Halobacterium salinarum]UDF60544.1 hypothetical protein JRZ79_13310 [Halobacterium sp. BOL4-2]
MSEDASPFNEKLADAIGFLTNVFALPGIPLDDRRMTLELPRKRAYKRRKQLLTILPGTTIRLRRLEPPPEEALQEPLIYGLDDRSEIHTATETENEDETETP